MTRNRRIKSFTRWTLARPGAWRVIARQIVSFHATHTISHRKTFNLSITVLARGLTSISDATSQKFMLLVQIPRREQKAGSGRYAVVYLDFAGLRGRKCGDSDFERWYARAKPDVECLMGVKVRH